MTSQITQLSGVPGFQSRAKTLSPEVVSTPDLGSPRAVLTVDIRVEGVEKVVVEECLKQVHLGEKRCTVTMLPFCAPNEQLHVVYLSPCGNGGADYKSLLL